MKKSTKRKIKRIFNLYNFAVIVCVAVIVVSAILLINPDAKNIFKKEEAKVADVSEVEEVQEEKKSKAKVSNNNERKTNKSKDSNDTDTNNNININTNTNTSNTANSKNTVDNKSNKTANTSNVASNTTSKSTDSSKSSVISKSDAIKLAKKQFEELKDEKLDSNDWEIRTITRADEDYFYFSTGKNSCEVKKSTGKITRVNSEPVE